MRSKGKISIERLVKTIEHKEVDNNNMPLTYISKRILVVQWFSGKIKEKGR